jgi:hypothetical protein
MGKNFKGSIPILGIGSIFVIFCVFGSALFGASPYAPEKEHFFDDRY